MQIRLEKKTAIDGMNQVSYTFLFCFLCFWLYTLKTELIRLTQWILQMLLWKRSTIAFAFDAQNASFHNLNIFMGVCGVYKATSSAAHFMLYRMSCKAFHFMKTRNTLLAHSSNNFFMHSKENLFYHFEVLSIIFN